MRQKQGKLALTTALLMTSVCGWTGSAAEQDSERAATVTIAARQKFFGVENVDPRTGDVRRDRVIFSWITNAGYAASFRGRGRSV